MSSKRKKPKLNPMRKLIIVEKSKRIGHKDKRISVIWKILPIEYYITVNQLLKVLMII